MSMDRAVIVYTTFPSLVEAERLGAMLVERRLAACVNILPGMISHYRWDDRVERGEEVLMLVKARASDADAVSAIIRAEHSYDTPAIMVVALESVERHYFSWLLQSTARPQAAS